MFHKKWYTSEELGDDYDVFKQQFIKAFTSSGYQLKICSKIINRQQRPDETTQSYYYDILSLCFKPNPEMAESEKILHLLRGLKPSLLQHVMLHEPSTCKDLLQYAKRAEVVVDITQSPPTVPTTTTSADEPTETIIAYLRIPPNNNYQNRRLSGHERHPSNHQQQWSSSTFNNRNGSNSFRQNHRGGATKVVCYNCNGIDQFSYQRPRSLK